MSGIEYNKTVSAQPSELATLLVSIKESLEREINDGKDSVNGKLDQLILRFDNQAARLDRQAALLLTGSRWTPRMNEWAERMDQAMEEKGRQIAALIGRIERLEKGQAA